MKEFCKKFISKIGIVFAMALVFGVLSCGSAYAETTWSPSPIGPNCSLSNNNLTIIGSNADGYSTAKATNGKTSGKWYWEVKVDVVRTPSMTASYGLVGIADNEAQLTNYIGLDGHSVGYQGVYGGFFYNGERILGGVTFETNDILGVALDLDLDTITYYKNGTQIYFRTGFKNTMSLPIFAAISTYYRDEQLTANFGATPFKQTIPDGYLPYDAQTTFSAITLNKTSTTLNVGQSDQLTATITPDTVTNKKVKWVSSDPTIVTVDENGKATGVKVGKATITATTTNGNNLYATCEVTVVVPVVRGNKALLTITMTNGLEKEYDLSMTEINAFINWYNSRQAGAGNAYYTFAKNASPAAFTKRTEYILYDKILEFNVDEYSK